MRWFPRISIAGWISCGDTGEYEGVSIEITWRAFVIELNFGRHSK